MEMKLVDGEAESGRSSGFHNAERLIARFVTHQDAAHRPMVEIETSP